MKSLPHDDAVLLQTLRAAGREALERKRLLGQYAVIWRDGRPAFVGPNPPVDASTRTHVRSRPSGGRAVGGKHR